jgi:AraC-like DNA-binding protein
MSIVGTMIGKSKKVHKDDIYQCMIDINDAGEKITISKLASMLKCSSRTIHRNIGDSLKTEKEMLNNQ